MKEAKTNQNNDIFYYVLTVVSGSYEDTYKRIVGIFKSQKEAEDYYHKHYEVTIEEIEENNKEFDRLYENEPKLDDFKLETGEYDEISFEKTLSEHWKNGVSYMAEDESTYCQIDKVQLICE